MKLFYDIAGTRVDQVPSSSPLMVVSLIQFSSSQIVLMWNLLQKFHLCKMVAIRWYKSQNVSKQGFLHVPLSFWEISASSNCFPRAVYNNPSGAINKHMQHDFEQQQMRNVCYTCNTVLIDIDYTSNKSANTSFIHCKIPAAWESLRRDKTWSLFILKRSNLPADAYSVISAQEWK